MGVEARRGDRGDDFADAEADLPGLLPTEAMTERPEGAGGYYLTRTDDPRLPLERHSTASEVSGTHKPTERPEERDSQERRYRTIVADPPWDHSDGTGVLPNVIGYRNVRRPRNKPAETTRPPYLPMTVGQIKSLPVDVLAEDNAHLYLWTTNRYLRQVWEVAEAWGFTGTCVITWCKPWMGALGGGAWQSNTEFCLFARRGNLSNTGQAQGRWFNWPRRRGAPVGEGQRRSTMHSAKPEAFLDLVEQVSPGPYLELFARRNRLGWDTWGHEALQHVEMTP